MCVSCGKERRREKSRGSLGPSPVKYGLYFAGVGVRCNFFVIAMDFFEDEREAQDVEC